MYRPPCKEHDTHHTMYSLTPHCRRYVRSRGTRLPHYHNVTALHIACTTGHPETVEVLLASGASARDPDARGRTPLHTAAEFGNVKAARLLLQAGDAVTLQPDHVGKPAALFSRTPEMTRLLLPDLRPEMHPQFYSSATTFLDLPTHADFVGALHSKAQTFFHWPSAT